MTPMAPPSLCTEPGCGELVQGGKCEQHRTQARRETDARRPNFHARGYDRKWSETRAAYLDDHPHCECPECSALPIWRRPRATDVDHLDGLGPKGPRGHDPSNLQALSHAHHSRITARHDGGFGRPKTPRP